MNRDPIIIYNDELKELIEIKKIKKDLEESEYFKKFNYTTKVFLLYKI